MDLQCRFVLQSSVTVLHCVCVTVLHYVAVN